ncbi:recombination regulator RecX [Undibacterium sp. RTI2.1]|uniref:recombination regulator RecX n=1 Tax=unclassified Undibacterium TaxID=2630295 RepID=UPI002AB5B558|nr:MULTISPECIES: recombination regulator RecX [unclassified Undibacterium]MDY7538778.1 recombination regulator RecX [Undibacterium sp. 5I1]MEB0032316.1 recombination regulator RecX [Undibacterium sp. RTI2.1]MEB0118235.1 recombination regulator RecX [Undibacterium sp. RTI2.2]MEB0229717.1 recombination regulator RecX [Undibacterium sp. 10I3]MEB0258418.1 recombination regulator RecX [Undibacterium sp. 5I1]
MAKLKISLKARALRYLSMREHSRMELEHKLQPHAREGEDISVLLDWLETAKYLSAERFADSLVNRRVARFGNQRILAELQSHQMDGQEIDRVKAELAESELSRAIDVLHRKFPHSPADHLERAKQARFMQQRGFSSKAIQTAMRAPRDEDTDE